LIAYKAPSSSQARKLQAEAMESQGKNEEAASVYGKSLEDNPKTSGIHYRLGKLHLDEADTAGSTGRRRSGPAAPLLTTITMDGHISHQQWPMRLLQAINASAVERKLFDRA